MSRRRRTGVTLTRTVAAGLALALCQAPAAAAGGFSFFAQGSKAMGMAGAFVAQADDPSAIFYNVGGLALSEGKLISVGTTAWTLNESLYQGLAPGIGAGTTGEQDAGTTLLPHVFAGIPLSSRLILGLGVTSPFYFETAWLAPESFAGRHVATGAELTTYDVTTNLSFAVSKTFGFGFGAIYRTSEVSLGRRLDRDNPFTGGRSDVASLATGSDASDGFGWQVGLLHRPSPRFSWGLAYRSPIEIDYSATGVLTQIATGNSQLDQLVAASLPFDQQLAASTRLELPETLALGIALGLSRQVVLEVDGEWTGWSTVADLSFAFAGHPVLDQTILLAFDDAMSFRAGFQYTFAGGAQLRAGAAFEESPQGDATVGALLADKDRTLYSLGFGKDWLDVAFTWVEEDQRLIGGQVDDLDGNYRSNAWMFGLTASF